MKGAPFKVTQVCLERVCLKVIAVMMEELPMEVVLQVASPCHEIE